MPRAPRASVWIQKVRRGVYKVRWREHGRKHATGQMAPLEAEATARDLRTRLAAAAFRNADGHAEPLAVVLERWRQVRLAAGGIQEGHAANVTRVLGSLFDRQQWRTTRDITQAAVDTWIASKPKHLRHTLTYLRLVLRWAASPAMRQPVAPIAFTLPRRTPVQRPLLTDEQLAAIRARVATLGQTPLVHCLLTYGWRPVSACRLTVGAVDLVGGAIHLGRLKNGNVHAHILLPETVTLLRPLVDGRAADAPLFRSPRGDAWRLQHGTAQELSEWWLLNVTHDLGLPKPLRGIYNLKRYAATELLRRAQGDVAVAQAITGHLRPDQLLRYAKTNVDRQRVALGLVAPPAAPRPRRVVRRPAASASP